MSLLGLVAVTFGWSYPPPPAAAAVRRRPAGRRSGRQSAARPVRLRAPTGGERSAGVLHVRGDAPGTDQWVSAVEGLWKAVGKWSVA